MIIYTFEYSQEFKNLIVEFHRGKEDSPFYQGYITAHLGGPNSRISRFVGQLYLEICQHLPKLQQTVLVSEATETSSIPAI